MSTTPMPTPAAPTTTPARVSSVRSLRVLVGLHRRLLFTRGRTVALALLGAVPLLIALVVPNTDDPPVFAFGTIRSVALSGLVPIVALVFGTAALGDLQEDATLVHVWLRPVSRWPLAMSAWVATVGAGTLFAVLPCTLAAALCRVGGRFVVATAVAALLGTTAYSALFVALGLRTSRSLAWGLGYVLLWEGSIGLAGSGLARLAVRTYTASLLRHLAGIDGVRVRYETGTVAAVVSLAVVTGVAVWLTRRLLDRVDIA